MKILMFGWEFPPHISGGLGTACKGIVSGLMCIPDTKIIFCVPKLFGDESFSDVTFAGANRYVKNIKVLKRKVRISASVKPEIVAVKSDKKNGKTVATKISGADFIKIETASLLQPYLQPGELEHILLKMNINPSDTYFNKKGRLAILQNGVEKIIEPKYTDLEEYIPENYNFTGGYGKNLFTETRMYAEVAGKMASEYDFDVIHAHDWLTYRAAVAAQNITGKPLVVHVHATEYDRSGECVNPLVYNIEKEGFDNADAVITVSNFTRDIVIEKYKCNPDKVFTVYNAVDFKPDFTSYTKPDNEKLITFLGRITYQKGPEYFLEAAYKVLQKVKNVRFVMAGNGDMFHKMILRAAQLGIADRFHFTDFLKTDEVRRLFAVSDVYVMPSVSEPFGIAPLEAVRSNVPVIISKQSGVTEVLTHAIKVDYWDIDAIADAMYALIKYPSLKNFFMRTGKEEIYKLKWVNCASQIKKVYNFVINKITPEF